jgi:chorismate--pyruvate lyase
MSAELHQEKQAIDWLQSPHDLDPTPGEPLLEWLTYEGLLTVRLKKACGGTFRLQVLNDAAGPGLMMREDWIRRVVLWCGSEACVYAESFLPHEALALLPSLRKLGNDPLGETLQSHPGVCRSHFDFTVLRRPRLPKPLEGVSRASLWARRSRFTIGDSSLTVAEAFLPGLLSCDRSQQS